MRWIHAIMLVSMLVPWMRAGTASAGSSGPTYYAAASGGATSGPGSIGSPWTLAYALTQLVAGDTLRCLDGSYTDTSATWYRAFSPTNSGTSGNPITIMSHNLHGATLNSRYDSGSDEYCPAIQPWEKNYVEIDGFTIVGRVGLRGEIPAPETMMQDSGSPYYVPGYPTFTQEQYDAAWNAGSGWATGHHNVLRNLSVTEGRREGTDDSLNHGIQVHSSRDCSVINCKVAGMNSTGNTATNSAAIMVFGCSHRITFEYCDADGTNVHSAYGQKGGNIFNCIWRYNIARNARSGDGATVGCGFLGKGNSGGDTFCDDHQYYGNIAINCFDAFFFNHNARRWLVYNNTAYNCTQLLRQWQLNSIDNVFFNNISYDMGRVYDIEALTGGSPNFEPYIEYSNYNCHYSATNFAQAAYGNQYTTMAAWVSAQSMDANSITTDPLFTNIGAEDFTLQGSSPCIGTGRGGAYPTQMGAWGMNPTRIGTNF